MRFMRLATALVLAAFLSALPSGAQEGKDTATVTGIVKFKGPKTERKPNEGMLAQVFC